MLHTRGIIFRTIKYGETSVITDIYTEERGLQSFIAGSVRSAKSAMPYSLFQPMQIVELVSYFREDKQSLHRLKELRLSQHYTSIPFDIRKGAVTLFMAEVLRKCVKDDNADPDFFHFLVDTLTLLDDRGTATAIMPVFFMAQLTQWLGIRPTIGLIPASGQVYFDLKEGTTTAHPDAFADTAGPEITNAFFQLLQTEAEQLGGLHMDASLRRDLLHMILRYFRHHIDQFDQIKAHEVLNTVFHG